MHLYPVNVTLHIIVAGAWLLYFVFEQYLKLQIKKADNTERKNIFTVQYLTFTKAFLLSGAVAILLTGVLLVVNNSHYGFFDMSNNHWLATKQILFVIILTNIFINVLPAIGKADRYLRDGNYEEIQKPLGKIFKANLLINILVVLNFLFAVTHKFYG